MKSVKTIEVVIRVPFLVPNTTILSVFGIILS